MFRPLLLLLLCSCMSVSLATSASDVERAANTVALRLDGVILNCPPPFQNYGSAGRRCVSTDLDAPSARRLLSASSLDLFGAWRSTDNPNYVYNWARSPSGYVSIILVPDRSGRGQALAFLDAPPVTTARAFQRVLRFTAPRLHGPDVMALQNRLMDVSKVARGQGGDGWFGPVTEANVIAFQSANALKPTGMVDKATWDRLFSSSARYFSPDLVRAIAARSGK